MSKFRILYIDDSILDQELVRASLDEDGLDFELITAGTRTKFEDLLKKGEYDLVLSDFNILGFEGLQVFDIVRAIHPDLPVVIVTGTGSEEVAVEAMRRGVADYVIKTPSHIRHLPQTLRTVLEKQRLQKIAGQAEERIFYQATLLASVSDAIIATDMQNNITYWNEAAQAQYGWLADEVVGQPMNDFIQNKSALESLELILQKISEDGFWKGELSQNRRDGERFPVLSTISLIKNRNEESIGFLAVNKDITERKQVEQDLQDSEEKFHSLFNNNNAIMLLIDSDSRNILDSNPAASEFYGWSQEELVHKNITEINVMSEEDIKTEMRKAVREQRASFEFKHRLASSEIRDVEVYRSPIQHKGKTLFFSIIHDITERKLAEKDLKENFALLVRTNAITVDRELLLYELKKEVNALLIQAGKEEKYPIHERRKP